MKGLIAAALFAVVTTVVLSFAANSGFTFKNLDSAPVVVDRGLPAPDVEIERDGHKVAFDEFGPDPTVPVESNTRAQPIVEIVKKPAPVAVKQKHVERPQTTATSPVTKRTTSETLVKNQQSSKRKPVGQKTTVEPPRHVVAREPEPEAVSLEEQIKRDREWRRKTLERWEREERERQKKEREKTRRAVRREFDDRGNLRNSDEDDYMEVEEVERIMKRGRGG